MFHGVTRSGMIEVDRIMTDDLGIHVELMMEHAGLNLAKISVNYADQFGIDKFVVVMGSGNNGGGGAVAARRIHNWGRDVTIWLAKGEPTREIPINQINRARSCGVNTTLEVPDLINSIVIDAYLGYNFRGELREDAIDVINRIKNSKIISLDVVSGLDVDSGINHGKINPLATAILAWPKVGMLNVDKHSLGDIYLVDIGVPYWVYLEDRVIDKIDLEKLKREYIKLKKASYVPIQIIKNKWQVVGSY